MVGGGEAALITAIDNAFKDETPLLFYFYNPQWKWANPEFADSVVQVELPASHPRVHQVGGRPGQGRQVRVRLPARQA